MKRLKRLLVTLLTAAMVVNTMPVSGIEAFAAQTETSEEKISITGEETVDEQLTGDEVADPEEDKDADNADISDENEEVAEDEDADTSDSEGTDTVSANDSDPAEEEAGQISEDKLDGYMTYDIWIGDQEFTEVTTTIWDKDHSGYAEYDDSTHTITFHDFGGVSTLEKTAQVYIGNVGSPVIIKGKANLYYPNEGYNLKNGIESSYNSLIIDEDADLTISTPDYGIYVVGTGKELRIKGKVDVTTNKNSRTAIYGGDSLVIESGADVKARTTENWSYAIFTQDSVIIEGKVEAVCQSESSIAIKAGVGIRFDKGAQVTATATRTGSIAIGEGCDIDIIDATITASGGSYAIHTTGTSIIDKDSKVLIVYPENGKVSDDGHDIVDKNGNTATYVELYTPTYYNLWVGSTQVNSENKDNIPVTGGGTAKYNPETKTLSFEGEVTGVNGAYDSSGITYLIYSSEDLNITGDAVLEDTSTEYSVFCTKNLSVNGTVKTSANNEAIHAGGSLTLGGRITAESQNDKAIYAINNININTASLSATSYGAAIESGSGGISINSGVVRAERKSGGYAIGSASGITIASGLSIVEPEGGKVVGNYICKSDGTTVADEVKITTVISSITATSSDIDSIPAWGNSVTTIPSITVTSGSPAYFDDGHWQKWNGSAWEDQYSGTFTNGKWRYYVQIRTDEDNGGVGYQLGDPLAVTVNGKTWNTEGTPSVFDDVSWDWAYSTEYTLNETPYDLWVGSAQVTSANMNNIPVTGGGKAVFNPSTNTLTFSGNVTGVTGSYDNSLIRSKLADLTIKGNATLHSDLVTFAIRANNLVIDGAKLDISTGDTGIYIESTNILTVKNNGELKIKGPDGGYGKGIRANDGTLVIESGKIDIQMSNDDGTYVKNLIIHGGEIKSVINGSSGSNSGIWVQSGKFEMTGGSVYVESIPYYGIYLAGSSDANIKGGVIESHVSGFNAAIFADCDLNISGGTIKAYNDDTYGKSIEGIKTNGKLSITGGHIDAEGRISGNPISIGSTRSIRYPVGAKLSDDSTVIVDSAGEQVSERVIIAGSGEIYVVSYDLNGKTGVVPKSVVAAPGAKITKPADPTETGYVFGGWYKEAACKNAWNFSTDTVNSDRTLYAKWTLAKYTVTYDKNKPADATKDVTGTTANSIHTYGEEKTLTPLGYMLEGYTFTNWNTKADGSGHVYNNRANVKNLTSTNGATVKLYAQWKKTTRKVIHKVTGTTTGYKNIPMIGESIYTVPDVTITQGAPAYFDVSGSGKWQKKTGEEWYNQYNGTFSEGTWRYNVEIRIDGSDATAYELGDPFEFIVDGEAWTVDTIPTVDDGYSYVWVASPEITVTSSDCVYDLWVGSTRVTSKNMNDIPGVLGGGKALFNPDTSTLTFTGNVTGVTGTYSNKHSSIYSKLDKLTVKGTATIITDEQYGILAEKDLIIDDSKLVIEANDSGVKVAKDFTIQNNGELKAKGTVLYGLHISEDMYVKGGKLETVGGRNGAYVSGKLNISGGEIKAVGTSEAISDGGVFVLGDIVISGGKVYAESSNAPGINGRKNINISGGMIKAVNAADKNSKSAIEAYNKLYITGGRIEAEGCLSGNPISLASGMSIKLPKDAILNSDNTKIVDKDGKYVTKGILIAGINEYLVAFDLNGGEGSAPMVQVIAKGNKAVKPSDPVSPANRIFIGWYKEKECKNLYDFNTAVNSDLVLYAGYKDEMTGAVDIASAFPDEAFRKYVSDSFDLDSNGKLSKYEISIANEIDIYDNLGIKSIKGVEKLTELEYLYVCGNELTSVDLGSNTKLVELILEDNKITSIDVSKLTNLEVLVLTWNKIESIDVRNNTKLKSLDLANNALKSVNTEKNLDLELLYLTDNPISNLNIGNNTKLRALYAGNCGINSIDLKNNTQLASLNIENNALSELILNNNTKLTSLQANDCGLTQIDLKANKELYLVSLNGNKLSKLDLSNNQKLVYLYVKNNNLAYLNLTANTKIDATKLATDGNIYDIGEVNELYSLTNIPGFDTSRASNWKGASYNNSDKTLYGFTTDTVTYDYLCRDGAVRQFSLRAILKNAEMIEVTFEGKGMEPVIVKVIKNGTITSTPVAPTVMGYEFAGWYFNDKDGVECPFDFTTRIIAPLKIHAKMVPISYTIKFDPNGAIGTMPDVIRQYEDGKELPSCTFSFGGRSFKEWNTKQNGKGSSFADRFKGDLTYNAGTVITLYAQWDNWGEIPADIRADLFGNDLNKANGYINGGVWYAFYDGSKWCKNTETLKKTYTGDAITFNKDIMVFHGFRRLWENRDYTVSYANNKLIVNGKNPSFTVKGKGSYNNSKTYGFTIEAADISDALVTSESVVTLAVKSKLGSVKPAVTFNGKKLSAGKDYDLVYFDGDTTDDSKRLANAAAFVIADANRTYTVAVKGKGNFKGLLKAANVKTIDPKAANTVQASKLNVTDKNGKAVKNIVIAYSGNVVNTAVLFDNTAGKTPDYQVVNASKKVLTYGTDYVVESADGELKAAGKYTLRILGKGSANADGITYVGSKSIACQIAGIDISKAKIAGMNTSVEYTGRPIELKDLFNSKDKNLNGGWDSVTLYTIDSRTKAKKKLTLSEDGVTGDYTVSMANNGAVGKFDIVFTGINGCSGTLKKSVKVTAYNVNDLKKDVIQRKIKVSVNGNAAYSKDGAIPNVTVTFNGTLLREGIDYKLAYKNNKKAVNDYNSLKAGARPTVTVKGLGNFAGSNATAYFNIEKRVISESNISVETADITYNAKGKAGYFLPKPNQIKLMDGSKALTVGKGKDIEALSAADYSFTYANAVTLADGTVKAAGSAVNANDKLPADKTTVIKVTVSVLSSGASPYSTGGAKKDISGTYKVIAAAKNIKSVKVALKPGVKTSFNNGEAISITAKDLIVSIKQGKVFAGLNENTDYEVVSVKNNRFLGTATVTIKGKGQYGGTKTFTFKIGARSIFG